MARLFLKTKYLFGPLLIISAVFVGFFTLRTDKEPTQAEKYSNTKSVLVHGIEVPVEIAKTTAEIQKGLSGRASLDPKNGMLFLFSTPDRYRFWMPDMHFPIDIIWISSNKEIIGITEDVSPEFDPAHPVFYTPPAPSQFVLEVNAGLAKVNHIGIGDALVFNHIE